MYAMLYMADTTGQAKYLQAARHLFAWQTNMLDTDGGMRNDVHNPWKGITVFAAISLGESLCAYARLLTAAEKKAWDARLCSMAEWLYANLTFSLSGNINYPAANAYAMLLCAEYLGETKYKARAAEMAGFAMAHIAESGVIYGEGKPMDGVTQAGCRPVDIGYNAEETLPLLVKYAVKAGDAVMLETLERSVHAHLHFMLPDGAWDNSFGSRVAKWTYWGSRTTDGCQGGFALLQNPVFAEAAARNARLLKACTHGGLLHGGPEYAEAGELPCVHHTFTHANALASALSAGADGHTPGVALPRDGCEPSVRYYPEISTYMLSVGAMRATVSGYDYALASGHASGGTLTLLWHRDVGVLIASSMVDYQVLEGINMQQPLKAARHRALTPRVEALHEGVRYAQCYDTKANITIEESDACIQVHVTAQLVTLAQEVLPQPAHCSLLYKITGNAVHIVGHVINAGQSRFLLPVIAKNVRVLSDQCKVAPQRIFNLSGGFLADEHVILPAEDGAFSVAIAVEGA